MSRTPLGALGAAALTLALAAPAHAAGPSNDDFANALTIRAPGDYSGTVAGATFERGEPAHAGFGPNRSVWFRYRARFTGTVAIDTIGSGFDTVLAAYTGDDVRALHEVASNDDALGGGPPRSEIRIKVRRGQRYRIALDSFDAAPLDGGQAAWAMHVSDGSIAGRGVALAIPAGQTMDDIVTDGVRLRVTSRSTATVALDVRVDRATARRLRLPSRVIAHGEGRLGWNDVVDANLRLTPAAQQALLDEVVLQGSVRVTLLGSTAPDHVATMPFRFPD